MADDVGNVAEEIQQEDVVQPHEDNNQESHSQGAQSQENSDKEMNFRKLREAKEKLERENRELREDRERASRPSNEEEQDDLPFDDDDIVEGRYVKQLHKEFKSLKNAYERQQLESIPERLQAKFSDFSNVVTPENVEKLKNLEPEIYASITSGTDLYGKGVSAYKTLKALGIVKDDPYKSDKEDVQQKQSRPMSTQAVKGSALSEANAFARGLTPELKKQLQMEMEAAIKGS